MKARYLIVAAIAAAIPLGEQANAQAYRYLYYDMNMIAQAHGTVQRFDWMNPNSEIHVLIKDPSTGSSEAWTFVMGPPTRSAEYGWDKDSLKPGDEVVLTFHPSRDGSHSGQLVNATLPSGSTLQATEPNPAG